MLTVLMKSMEKQSTMAEDEELLRDANLSGNGQMAVVYRLEKKKIVLD